MRFMSVDLPDPEGPIIATYSFRASENDTPCSACTSVLPMSYVFHRSSVLIRTSCVIFSGNSGTVSHKKAQDSKRLISFLSLLCFFVANHRPHVKVPSVF